MSISPFHASPASPETETRRARLVMAIALVGIVATLLAYAVSPSVRHAVGHAAHSVKGAVSRALDHDSKGEEKKSSTKTTPSRTSTVRVTTPSGAALTVTATRPASTPQPAP